MPKTLSLSRGGSPRVRRKVVVTEATSAHKAGNRDTRPVRVSVKAVQSDWAGRHDNRGNPVVSTEDMTASCALSMVGALLEAVEGGCHTPGRARSCNHRAKQARGHAKAVAGLYRDVPEEYVDVSDRDVDVAVGRAVRHATRPARYGSRMAKEVRPSGLANPPMASPRYRPWLDVE